MNRTPSADSRLAILALFALTAAWGASFVLMKPAIERQPIPDFLATRFVIAAIILILVRPSVLSNITPRVWWTGGIAGVVLSIGYVAQTIGLHYATAAITGFLTGLYVVGTPLLAWLIFRQPLNRKVIVAASLGLAGLGVISLNSFGIGIGEIWIIVGAIFFALHIVVLGRWAPGNDSYALTVVQIVVVAICTAGMTFADGDGYIPPPDVDVWIGFMEAMQTRHQPIRSEGKIGSDLQYLMLLLCADRTQTGVDILQTEGNLLEQDGADFGELNATAMPGSGLEGAQQVERQITKSFIHKLCLS